MAPTIKMHEPITIFSDLCPVTYEVWHRVVLIVSNWIPWTINCLITYVYLISIEMSDWNVNISPVWYLKCMKSQCQIVINGDHKLPNAQNRVSDYICAPVSHWSCRWLATHDCIYTHSCFRDMQSVSGTCQTSRHHVTS